MKLIFHPDAEREFHEGIRQYLLIDPALGADFEAKEDSPVKSRRTNRRNQEG